MLGFSNEQYGENFHPTMAQEDNKTVKLLFFHISARLESFYKLISTDKWNRWDK